MFLLGGVDINAVSFPWVALVMRVKSNRVQKKKFSATQRSSAPGGSNKTPLSEPNLPGLQHHPGANGSLGSKISYFNSSCAVASVLE